MRAYFCTEAGVNKSQSEDCVLIGNHILKETTNQYLLENGPVVLADGVGGNQGGAYASEFVCREIMLSEKLSPEILENINLKLLEFGKNHSCFSECATTMSCMFFRNQGEVDLFHIGNGRVFSIKSGEYLKQLTEDDTVVQYLINAGVLSEEEALTYPSRHEITNCFGGGKKNLFRLKHMVLNYLNSSLYLLTCDGIHDYLNLDEMEEVLSLADGNWLQAVQKLVTRAKEKESPDDCTAIIVDCSSTEEP